VLVEVGVVVVVIVVVCVLQPDVKRPDNMASVNNPARMYDLFIPHLPVIPFYRTKNSKNNSMSRAVIIKLTKVKRQTFSKCSLYINS